MPLKKLPELREGDYTTVKVPNDLIARVDALVGTEGFKGRGEIVKTAIREYLRSHKSIVPQFIMRNYDERRVEVWDERLRTQSDIQITPKGIHCPICDASYCEHIRFALSQPDIQEIIKQKRREGWRLPDG